MKNKRRVELAERQERLRKANEFIEVIGSFGRKWFTGRFGFSKFLLDERGRCWFLDGHTGFEIYLHYKHWRRGFSGGGTERTLVCFLTEYIMWGTYVPGYVVGPFPEWLNDGDPWGYGHDMEKVRQAARDLGILNSVGYMWVEPEESAAENDVVRLDDLEREYDDLMAQCRADEQAVLKNELTKDKYIERDLARQARKRELEELALRLRDLDEQPVGSGCPTTPGY